jgi:hypothetical protein
VSFGGRFGDDASAAPTMATTSPNSLATTSNHRPVAVGHLGGGTGAAEAANEAVQPPDIAEEVAVTLPRHCCLTTVAAAASKTTHHLFCSSSHRRLARKMAARVVSVSTCPYEHTEEVVLPKITSFSGRGNGQWTLLFSSCNADTTINRGPFIRHSDGKARPND